MPYYRSNGLQLHYEEYGEGEPLILQHGFGQDGSAWVDAIPTYARFFRVLAVDMRGCGRSEADEPGYSVADLAGDAVALMDHLAIGKAHYAGFSLGGALALELAIAHSDRLRSLSLHSTWQGGPCPHMSRWVTMRHRIIATNDPAVIDGTRLLNFFSPEFVDAHEDRVDEFFRRAADNPYPISVRAVDGHVGASLRHDVRGRLERIAVPTLITVGSLDRTTLPSQARYLHDHIRGSELVIFDGSGHCTKFQCVDEFITVSLGFLIKHQGGK
jgi:pimeloyl-ACP methyl ester carboxylesterase